MEASEFMRRQYKKQMRMLKKTGEFLNIYDVLLVYRAVTVTLMSFDISDYLSQLSL